MPIVIARSRVFAYRKVEIIPEFLEPGILYYAPRYATAAHLCACGCGWEVITAIGPGHWRLYVTGGRVTLRPSIGNGSFPCRSHYFISNGHVNWASDYTNDMIAQARLRDNPRAHVTAYQPAPIPTLWECVVRFVRWLFRGRR